MTDQNRTTADLVAEALALDAAATPGPWESRLGHCDSLDIICAAHNGYEGMTVAESIFRPEDAAQIVRARTLMPELARRLDIAADALRSVRNVGDLAAYTVAQEALRDIGAPS